MVGPYHQALAYHSHLTGDSAHRFSRLMRLNRLTLYEMKSWSPGFFCDFVQHLHYALIVICNYIHVDSSDILLARFIFSIVTILFCSLHFTSTSTSQIILLLLSLPLLPLKSFYFYFYFLISNHFTFTSSSSIIAVPLLHQN